LESRGTGEDGVRACCCYVVRVFKVVNLPPTSAIFFSSDFVRDICEPKLFSLLKKVPIIFFVDFEEFNAVPLVCFVVLDIVSSVSLFFFVKNNSS
jgi:hypothetical protein